MVIELRIPGIRYEVESLVRMLLGDHPVTVVEDESGETNERIIICGHDTEDAFLCTVKTLYREKSLFDEVFCPNDLKEKEQAVCRVIYRQLSELLGHGLPWGMLTGVRPVKLVRQMAQQGMQTSEISQRFADYGVSESRIDLSLQTWQNQKEIIENCDPQAVSLYVAIPFCPTRCSYCSFVSHSIERASEMVSEYLEALIRELEYTAELVKQHALSIISVYIGGGTPTSLSAPQLDRLLGAIRNAFDLSACTEFTVEAGRPDTFSIAKLDAMAKHGVDRISINPQTLNDKVLETIGRRHTAEQFFEAYEMSKNYSFDRNIDLIAGLPGDTMESFRHSLDTVIAMHPENITVHALTIKHASDLIAEAPRDLTALEMVEYSRKALAEAGYLPYYLYRQKGTVDALENVGYTLPGKACRYNVYIMDDGHTIISAGAGGVTKLVPPHPQKIERTFNYKYPYEYLSRFETVLERKRTLPLEKLNQYSSK